MSLVYIDGIIIFSQNHEEHLDHLEHILGLLEEARNHLKLKKYFFCKDEVEYLGHRILSGTLSTYENSKATQALRDAFFPLSSTQLRSFLGAANLYRKFVKDYAKKSAPLNDMLKKRRGQIGMNRSKPIACRESLSMRGRITLPLLRH